MTEITAEYARERLDYDPATGVFLWRYCEAMSVQWNGKWAGTVAGSAHCEGYRAIRIDGRLHLAHRIAWLWITGQWPVDQIDHINGAKDDNRFSNLREATDAENRRNMPMRADNTSGCVGVAWHKALGKWQAEIRADRRTIYLGVFADKADAVAAREAAEISHGFHQNHGRTA